MRPAPRAVLLDAFGTLVTLEAPAPRLRALLAERLEVEVSETQAGAALRAEVAYYRAHMREGVDLVRVAGLHAACAEVLRRALPEEPAIAQAPPALIAELLLDSLRFRVYAEVPAVLAQLRAAGRRLIVASNWDASLDVVLDRCGLLDAVDGVVNSAAAGFAKPDPRLLRSALRLAGVGPAEAVHVGDSLEQDVGAARAAGVRPVLLSRDPTAVPSVARLTVIETLAELPALLSR